jgi:serine/threonine-protein phosphatase 5
MASAQEEANALKVQGNKAFAQHDWPTAVNFYNQAIEKYDQEPSFFSNRAQVRRTPTRATRQLRRMAEANLEI